MVYTHYDDIMSKNNEQYTNLIEDFPIVLPIY